MSCAFNQPFKALRFDEDPEEIKHVGPQEVLGYVADVPLAVELI